MTGKIISPKTAADTLVTSSPKVIGKAVPAAVGGGKEQVGIGPEATYQVVAKWSPKTAVDPGNDGTAAKP